MSILTKSIALSALAVTLGVFLPQNARCSVVATTQLSGSVLPSSGPGSSVGLNGVYIPPFNTSMLSATVSGSNCPGVGCATGSATGSVVLLPRPVLSGLVTGDTGAFEQLFLVYIVDLVGETIVPPPGVLGTTGFLGAVMSVHGTLSSGDPFSSASVVGRLFLTTIFPGGGGLTHCDVLLSNAPGSVGFGQQSGSCLDVVPVSFVALNTIEFEQVLSMSAGNNASANYLSTAEISSLEFFDSNMNFLGNIIFNDSGIQIPGVSSPPLPEPATLALLGVGLAGLCFSRRRNPS